MAGEIIGNALGEEQKFNGYAWGELKQEWKTFLVSGFLLGHKIGQYEGLIEGHLKGTEIATDAIEENMNVKVDDLIKKKIRADSGKTLPWA